MQELELTLAKLRQKHASHPVLSSLWILYLEQKSASLIRDIHAAERVIELMEQEADMTVSQIRDICLLYG